VSLVGLIAAKISILRLTRKTLDYCEIHCQGSKLDWPSRGLLKGAPDPIFSFLLILISVAISADDESLKQASLFVDWQKTEHP